MEMRFIFPSTDRVNWLIEGGFSALEREVGSVPEPRKISMGFRSPGRSTVRRQWRADGGSSRSMAGTPARGDPVASAGR